MKTKLIYILPLLALAVINPGCRKKTNDVTPTKDLQNQSYVQWFNGTLNSARNFIFVNGVQINGSASAYGALFPASSFAFAVFPGSSAVNIRDTSSVTTQVAQNFVHPFNPGQSYTIFTYDTITSPKRLVVENSDVFYPNDNNARVRFLNLIYNPTAIPAVDIFSVNNNTYLAMGIPVGQITSYFSFTPGQADTWQVRQSGTTTVMSTLTIGTSTLVAKRFYTAVYRGSHRAAGNRAFSLIANH